MKKKAVIVVTSNRGLAGGYNSNVVKMVTENEAFTKGISVSMQLEEKDWNF